MALPELTHPYAHRAGSYLRIWRRCGYLLISVDNAACLCTGCPPAAASPKACVADPGAQPARWRPEGSGNRASPLWAINRITHRTNVLTLNGVNHLLHIRLPPRIATETRADRWPYFSGITSTKV